MTIRRKLHRALVRLAGDERGAAVVETAIIAPVLALLALGSYDMSRMIARQHDLQGGASDVEGIILAVATGPGTNVNKIEAVLESSLDLSNSGSVALRRRLGSWSGAPAREPENRLPLQFRFRPRLLPISRPR